MSGNDLGSLIVLILISYRLNHAREIPMKMKLMISFTCVRGQWFQSGVISKILKFGKEVIPKSKYEDEHFIISKFENYKF